MDKQYSVQFFTNFLDSLQEHCKSFLDFNQLVEVSGYVCVEIDNTKKERYVLSELVQSCGNIISESYCTKAFKTPLRMKSQNGKSSGTKSKTKYDNKIDPESEDEEARYSSRQTFSKDSQNSTSAETELGLRISSVSSLAEPEKELLSSDSQSSLNGDEVIEVISEDAEIKDSKQQESNFPQSQSQLYKDEWEGRDTFVYTFTSVKTNGSQESNEPEGESSQESSKPPVQSLAHSLWHQPIENRNLDLDQILSQGQSWSGSESEPKYTTSVDFEMKSETVDEHVMPLSGGDGDNDLTVLSNEYFTAQMLAHTRKALDSNVLHEANLQASVQPSTSSKSDTFDSKPTGESSDQISMRSHHVAGAAAQAAGSLSSGSKTCVLIIDEDSDDIIEVDMEQSSDEDNSELSQEFTSETQPKWSSSKRKTPLNDEEKQRKRYRSSLKYQRYAVKLFNDFQKNRGEGVRPIQTMHPEKLDEVLADFYTSLKKSNGEEFGSMSLRNVQSHLERYLKDANYPFSITKDEQFRRSKQILMNKIAIARARAKPATGKPIIINDDDISVLFETGELGADSPDSLLNTMWFMNSMLLQIKQNADHYELKWGDIGLCENEFGREVLECFAGKSTGRRIYCDENDPEQCYVTLYKKYRNRRPSSTLTADSPFYLSPNRVFTASSPWFSVERASVSRLTGVFKRMATPAGLCGKRLP